MSILGKFIMNLIHAEEHRTAKKGPIPEVSVNGHTYHDNNTYHDDEGMHIVVYSAIGGRIVQFYQYNSTKGEAKSTYIITSEEPFDHRLGELITLEALKRG